MAGAPGSSPAETRGRELLGIVDPHAYRERLLQPKVIALGTNDPYWPLEALNLYLDGLEGPAWVSYAPNAGHGLPVMRVAGLAAALGRHVAGEQRLPTLDWDFTDTPGGVACRLTSDNTPDDVRLWRADVSRPVRGFSAFLIECRYPREPLPLLLTTSVHVQSTS